MARKFTAPVFVPANTLTYFDGPRPVAPTLAKAARIWPTFMDQPFDAVGALRAAKGVKVAGYAMGTDMTWTGPRPQGGLAEGQAVPGAPGWTVIESPGHSDDSIALWNSATGTLLSGDAVVTADGRAWHTPETIDDRKAESTRRRLEQLPVSQLLPGHGRPVRSTGTVWETQRR